MRYIVVSGSDWESFLQRVNYRIKTGFTSVGGIAVVQNISPEPGYYMYYQAMTGPKGEDEGGISPT